MCIAFLPGTFDPPTNGHLELMKKASGLFQKLYVGITDGAQKKTSPILSVNERVSLLKPLLHHLPNIEVLSFTGLTADCAKKKGANILVRGARTGIEYESEMLRAAANRIISGIETCIIPAEPAMMHISSTLVREILAAGGPLEAFLPKPVIAALRTNS